jgi:hypothetical protein
MPGMYSTSVEANEVPQTKPSRHRQSYCRRLQPA